MNRGPKPENPPEPRSDFADFTDAAYAAHPLPAVPGKQPRKDQTMLCKSKACGVDLSAKELKAMTAVVEYLYVDECEDFIAKGEPENHIFRHVAKLAEAIQAGGHNLECVDIHSIPHSMVF